MSTVGVFVSLFDHAGRILLVQHAYGSRQWSTPGGQVEPGESLLTALTREVTEEIACEIRISHLIGVYAKPYCDDFVLSFHATIVSGIPHASPPEISDVVFFSRDSLPPELEFTRRIRIEDAFGGCRGIVRVFDSADSLAPSFDTHVPRRTKT
jgi:ADP-ribose pyrophosphatase YjhB (NUDIX family)